MHLLSSADFFLKKTFSKNSFWNNLRVSNGMDPGQDRLLVQIWVQTVCKGYQQTTKVADSKERAKKCASHIRFWYLCKSNMEGSDKSGQMGSLTKAFTAC